MANQLSDPNSRRSLAKKILRIDSPASIWRKALLRRDRQHERIRDREP